MSKESPLRALLRHAFIERFGSKLHTSLNEICSTFGRCTSDNPEPGCSASPPYTSKKSRCTPWHLFISDRGHRYSSTPQLLTYAQSCSMQRGCGDTKDQARAVVVVSLRSVPQTSRLSGCAVTTQCRRPWGGRASQSRCFPTMKIKHQRTEKSVRKH